MKKNKSKEIEMLDDLQQLTGQESGIVVFGDEAAFVCNWASTRGIPRYYMDFVGLFGTDESIPQVEGVHVKNIANLLDDIDDILNFSSGDLTFEDLINAEGVLYDLRDSDLAGDIMVIAPYDWH